MALELTKQAEAAIRARQYFGQYEMRFSNYGALQAYIANANQLLPKDTLEALKKAQNVRSLVFPVLQKRALTVITAKACTYSGSEENSAKPSFSSIVRGFAIKHYDKVAANNYVSLEDQYAAAMANGIRSVMANLDTYAAAQLDANKNTALAATTLRGVSVVANAYRLDPTVADKLYFYIPTLMERNDVAGMGLSNIMTTEGRSRMIEYESKANGNDQNLAGVLNGNLPSASGYQHFRSNRLSNGSGVAETYYVAPTGSLGMFSFYDSDANTGITNGVGGKKMYVMTDGILGMQWAVTETPICDDLSGTYGAGYESCNGTQYAFVADFSFMNAYSSDNTSPIHKVEIAVEA
jgi:hypothetical protein